MTLTLHPAQLLRPLSTAAGIGLVPLAIIAFWMPGAVLSAWLTADLLVIGLSLGALAIVMMHNLTGGAWGEAVRPQLLAMAAALPIGIVGLVPPLIYSSRILVWTTASPASLAEHARAKLSYFAPAFFVSRTLAILVIWVCIAWALSIWSRNAAQRRSQAVSIGGLALYMVSLIFFATDWMIAPDPAFYSTIYPALEASGEVAGALALAILLGAATNAAALFRKVDRDVLVAEDLANLLFGFVLLWAYLAFMQWLVIWSGDLPDEIGWYLRRSQGGWLALLFALILLHVCAPIAALLSRRLKRSPTGLTAVAAICLFGHITDVMWRIAPNFEAGTLAYPLALLAAVIGLGGAWAAALAWLIAARQQRRNVHV